MQGRASRDSDLLDENAVLLDDNLLELTNGAPVLVREANACPFQDAYVSSAASAATLARLLACSLARLLACSARARAHRQIRAAPVPAAVATAAVAAAGDAAAAHRFLPCSYLNDTLFLKIINVVDYSILVGVDEERNELVVGIIDYMRQYDIIKKIESAGKSAVMGVTGGEGPTVIQPSHYKDRFQMAMERYFVVVPDKFSCFDI